MTDDGRGEITAEGATFAMAYGVGDFHLKRKTEVLAEFEEYSRQYPREICLEHWANVVGHCQRWVPDEQSGAFAAAAIRDRIERREPFSLVRIGDGEGNILFYGSSPFGKLASFCIASLSMVKFGVETLIEDHIEFFGDLIVGSVENSDFFCFPEKARLEQSFSLEGRGIRGTCGIRASTHALAEKLDLTSLVDKPAMTAHIHHKLLPFYFPLLQGETFLGLVCGYDELGPLIQQRTSIRRVEHIRVPLEAKRSDNPAQPTDHFPRIYREVTERLRPPYPGAIYLVAAGLLAKGYCQTIKERGGIAIDIGSTADVWMGRKTRPRVTSELLEAWTFPT